MNMDRRRVFVEGFLRQWRTVGAIIPSSDQLGRTLASMADRERIIHAVELGPGTGALTRPLLNRLRTDARLLAVELYTPFADHLRNEVRDPRLEVVNEDARRLPDLLADRGWPAADLILSSIPMTPIPPHIRNEIADAMLSALRPGGQLLMWQYTPFIMEGLMKRRFHVTTRRVVFRNVPPAVVYGAVRPLAASGVQGQRRAGGSAS